MCVKCQGVSVCVKCLSGCECVSNVSQGVNVCQMSVRV